MRINNEGAFSAHLLAYLPVLVLQDGLDSGAEDVYLGRERRAALLVV